MRVAFLAIVLGSLIPANSFAETFTIQPGKYKTTMTMKMSMMPNPMTNETEQCITPEEATKSPEDIVNEMGRGGQCSSSDVSSGKNRMAFTFQCTGGEMGDMSGRYELALADDNYTFKGNIKSSVQGMEVDMMMDGQSKRIGDC